MPYLEALSEYQLTINYSDEEKLKTELEKLLLQSKKPTDSFIPAEFTAKAMAKRLEKTLEIKNYCMGQIHRDWTMDISFKLVKSDILHDDCNKTCEKINLKCSTDYFRLINTESYLEKVYIDDLSSG